MAAAELDLSFPPIIKVDEFLSNEPEYRQPPNAYMIYRKVYNRTLKSKRMRLSLTSVSKLSSASWKKAPAEVKGWYKKFAAEVRQQHRKMYLRYKEVRPGPTKSDVSSCKVWIFVPENPGQSSTNLETISTEITKNNVSNKHINIMDSNNFNDLNMYPLRSPYVPYNNNSPLMTTFTTY
ncbi:917_t:CDS:1 [Gigaspora margarita]|uniref:917_t:CDS:1 n=1 Tax=Gigaspora margarita TaxID=4874 RepID=A0ABN7UY07_GIGMA|nr:917_t:CDS:1 [Gigaspora margarita]